MPALRLRSNHVTEAPSPRTVVVVSSDLPFQRALVDALGTENLEVVAGADHSCLRTLNGWDAEWRDLDVEAVVIDLGADPATGLDALDVVRRRDAQAFVILLSRRVGAVGSARLGANLILEGEVKPEGVIKALAHRPASRAQ